MNSLYYQFLSEKDLSSGRKILLVNDEKFIFSSVVKSWVRDNWLIVLERPFEEKMEKLPKRSRQLVDEGKIKLFSWDLFSRFDKWQSEDQAYKDIDALFDFLKNRGGLALEPTKYLYKNDNVELVFKKKLILELNYYYQSVKCFNNLAKYPVVLGFYPSIRWENFNEELIRANRRHEAFDEILDRVHIVHPKRRILKHLYVRVIEILKLLAVWLWVVFKVVRINKTVSKPENIKACMRLFRNSIGLKGEGTNQIDWLIDGKKFRPDNVLFVAETPLRNDFINDIGRLNYRLCQIDFKNLFKSLSLDFYLKEVWGAGLKYLVSVFFKLWTSPLFVIKTTYNTLFEYFRWKYFLSEYRPEHYVTYNDLGFQHIFRNILLNQVGCKSYFYNHSNNMILDYDISGVIYGAAVERAFLYFDYEYHWGKFQLEITRRQRSQSKCIKAIGSPWIKQMVYSQKIADAIFTKWSPQDPGIRVVAFTTGNNFTAINPETYHYAFLQSLSRLLENKNYPGLKIIFKSKGLHYGTELGRVEPKARELYDKLKNHPRFVVIDSFVSAQSLIYFADLVMSMAFASPGIEALIGGKRSFYYDPLNYYPNSFFQHYPNLVAHSEKDLLRLIPHWLNLSDDHLKDYVDRHVKDEFEKEAEELLCQ